jgi:hypothetical protein
MSNQYAPLITWSCSKCGKGGELSIPPATYGVDTATLAARAHARANGECDDLWGNSQVRVSQGEYPD